MASFRSLNFESRSLSFEKAVVRVDVCEKNPQLEPRVLWNVSGRPFYGTDASKCFEELRYSVARTSIYSKIDDSVSLSSPEHLAPVFLMWPRRRFNVHVEGSEVPLLDGSALPFFHALRRESGTPEDLVFYDAPVHESFAFKGGAVRIYPSETFEVEYVLDRPDWMPLTGGFRSSARASIYSAEDLYNIFEARTFICEQELAAAREAGLLNGVDEKCGMLLEESVCAENRAKYRVDEEPAFHKILDLLGDLAFVVPALPKIHIEILNGGHTSHRKILEKVLPYAVQCRICP
ncbi:MAG: UDP-3-O-acyl-N-acetylglucosamine deacetylase [Fibrobacter sp.]|nr:UDP-3-O-acyl-N-acetylglucosamine deacetylase [Fibrobacter sp.]